MFTPDGVLNETDELKDVTVFPTIVPIMSWYPSRKMYLCVYRQHFESHSCMVCQAAPALVNRACARSCTPHRELSDFLLVGAFLCAERDPRRELQCLQRPRYGVVSLRGSTHGAIHAAAIR